MTDLDRYEELRAALESDMSTLLAELGTYGVDFAPRDALEKGMRIYRALEDQLRLKICQVDAVRSLVEEDRGELEIAAAIADLIATMEQHLPVATVAALVIKHGVPQLCAAYWQP